MTAGGVPCFGERREGTVYRPRPGAYLVGRDASGRIAIMATRKGAFLPGGGLEPGESLQDGLRREVLEECGRDVADLERIGEAVEYVDAEGEGSFAKQCTFFRGTLGPQVAEPVESDHVLTWLSPAVAIANLVHRSQGWAVMQTHGS